MGACLSKGENARTEQLPGKAQKYVDYYEKPQQRVSIESNTTNPEELLKKQSDDAGKRKEDSPTAPSENKHAESPQSFITMLQLLQSENEGNNDLQEVNYQSSIIRPSKREKKGSGGEEREGKSKMRSSIMSEIQKQQKLDCNKSEMDAYSRLLIRLQKMDFEFILPKLRAGPLVVPLINYSSYEV